MYLFCWYEYVKLVASCTSPCGVIFYYDFTCILHYILNKTFFYLLDSSLCMLQGRMAGSEGEEGGSCKGILILLQGGSENGSPGANPAILNTNQAKEVNQD